LGLLRRGAIGLAAAVVPILLVRPAAKVLVNVSQPASIVALLRSTGIVLIGMIWWVAPTGLIKLGLTLLMAAGIGNLLSLAYPPFQIVDFMYSRLTARLLGLGVFNIADLYIPVSYACLAVGLVQYAVRRSRNFRDSRR
jgi:lipoprotein signal peptidase